jgi:hypothetical protein
MRTSTNGPSVLHGANVIRKPILRRYNIVKTTMQFLAARTFNPPKTDGNPGNVGINGQHIEAK